MQAYLLDDFKVEIDARAAEIGGCWQGKPRDGIPTVWGMDELRFFYKRTLEYEQPVILDIGANTGAFSVLAAMNPAMRSYAFEPAPNTYEILNRNISLNRLDDKIKTFQIALSDRNGRVVLKYPKSGKDSGLACIGEPLRFNEWVEYEVDVRRLDDFATEYGIEKVDLVKIDTEGCELFVLKGAEELIKKCSPGIFCEYNETNAKQFGYHSTEIVKLLTSWGYKHAKVSHEDMYFYNPAKSNFGEPKLINLVSSTTDSNSKSGLLLTDTVAHFECAERTEKLPMKVAFVKQILDVFGPWSSMRWKYTTPKDLFNIWPNKASVWEMTCLLKPDWYVIPQKVDLDYTKDAVRKHSGREHVIRRYTTNVVNVKDIPFWEYDIVITADPILDVPEDSKVVFAYYMNEHWDRLYAESLKNPIGKYDLFLAHMMDSNDILSKLPQAVSLPLLRDPNTVRTIFNEEKQNIVWADWRTLTALAETDLWNEAAVSRAKDLERVLDMPIAYKEFVRSSYGFVEPPTWGDAARYLEQIAKCRYYVAVGRNSGAGQGLCDAASLQCICIGEKNRPYHRLICHPSCLCVNKDELPVRLRRVVASPNLQEEVLAWQDKMLLEHFVEKPLFILNQAIEMKIKKTSRKLPKQQAITLFAIPKAFRGQDAVRQRNAIKSWTLLDPRPEIILFGDDGVAQVAEEFGLRHMPDVKRNSYGTPLINDIFDKAQAIASNNILAYVNSDIILLNDFMPAVEMVAKRFNEFLMIEQRWDTDISEPIDFEDADWEKKLRQFVRQNASLHAVTGVDCFVFTKCLWSVIPPFGIGRTMWDIWLVREALLCDQPSVDASKMVTIVHQNHDFSHIPGGTDAAIFKTEVQRNLALGGNDTSWGYTSQAIWELRPDGIVLRPVSEFLKERNPSIALKCIESAYHQAPEIVKEQCQHVKVRTNPDYLSKLLSVARKELLSGPAKNAAKLLLISLGQENISVAGESFRKGFRCLRNGDASEAIKYLEKAAKNCMTLPNLHYALAAAYAELGDILSSKKACEIELSLQPDNDGARRLLERIKKAIAEYNQLPSSSTEVKV